MLECGQCSLCCKLREVLEIGKPLNVWCLQIHKDKWRGCTSYSTRPESCREFSCLWKQELIRPGLTPLVTKVVCEAGMSVFGPTIYLYMQKDSHLYQFQRYVDEWFSKNLLVCIVFGRQRRWVVPDSRKEEVQKYLKEQNELAQKAEGMVAPTEGPVSAEPCLPNASPPSVLVRDADVQPDSDGQVDTLG